PTAPPEPSTTDLLHQISLALRNRDPGFMWGTVAVTGTGAGRYDAAVGNGKTATKRFTFEVVDGTVKILTPAVTTAAAPDGYAPALAAMRAAAASEPTFEDEWKRKRQAEFDAEHARIAAAAPEPRVLSADDRAKYRAPEPYSIALAKRLAAEKTKWAEN